VLVGYRPSILRMTGARRGLLYAAMLVVSAAMAREYDAVSWLHHPEDLLAPFAASLILASVLWLWMWGTLKVAGVRMRRPTRHAKRFLTGYWLTAPLAWLYAVPVESFWDELTALKFNLTALSIVSLWRVFLFGRIVAVLYRVPLVFATTAILVPCVIVAFVALMHQTLQIVSIMGGVRLSETESLLVGFTGRATTILFWFFWPVAVLLIVNTTLLRGKVFACRPHPSGARLPSTVWAIPAIAIIVLGVAAIRFQPPLIEAAAIDQALIRENYPEAFRRLKLHDPAYFPAHWDPVPTGSKTAARKPKIGKLVEAIAEEEHPAWVVDLLTEDSDLVLLREYSAHFYPSSDSGSETGRLWVSDTRREDFLRDLRALRSLPLSDPVLSARLAEIEAAALKEQEQEQERETQP